MHRSDSSLERNDWYGCRRIFFGWKSCRRRPLRLLARPRHLNRFGLSAGNDADLSLELPEGETEDDGVNVRWKGSLENHSIPQQQIADQSNNNNKIKQDQLRLLQTQLHNLQVETLSSKPAMNTKNDHDNIEDSIMAEWEEIERMVDKEQQQARDEEILIPGLSPPCYKTEEVTSKTLEEERAVLDTLTSGRGRACGMEEAPSLFGGINYNEERPPPGATPSHYHEKKKYITEYKITDDGAIQLSPEAYQAACSSNSNVVNFDGSLNFGTVNVDGSIAPFSISGHRGGGGSSIFSPSVLEAVTVRPTAPYPPYNEDDGDGNKNEISTINDVKEQARKALEYAAQHPDAGEELHRRIMAEIKKEEEDAEAMSLQNDVTDDHSQQLFEEAMVDPKKSWEFWNHEFLKTKKEELTVLERLLDEKMELIQQMTLDGGSNNNNDDFDYMREHKKNVIQYYEDNYPDLDWMTTAMENDDGNDNNRERVVELGTEEGKEGHVISNDQSVATAGEWVLVEDPTTSDEPFYWNSVTEEMRWDLPTE